MVVIMVAVELSFSNTLERLAARPAHRELLQRLHGEGKLLAAGPWADDSGALLIFTGDSTAVSALMAADPYYSTDGVTVLAIREWRPIVGSSAMS